VRKTENTRKKIVVDRKGAKLPPGEEREKLRRKKEQVG